MEVIVFPDAVSVSINFLAAAFLERAQDVKVGSRVGAGDRFVVVRLVDTEIQSLVVQRSTLEIENWVDKGPTSQEDAQDLGQLTRGLLGSMRGTKQAGTTVYSVEDVQGLHDEPDPLTGKERFVFEVATYMRGAAV